MTDRRFTVLGIALTVLMHGLLGTALALLDRDRSDDGPRLRRLDDNAVVIEASLAYKRTTRRKTRQPQKKKAPPKVAPPEATRLTANPDAPAKPPERNDRVRPQDIDVDAVLAKHRNVDLFDDEADVAGDSEPEVGSAEGSEWGTAEEARGDPYVGELHGRIKKVWKIPTLATNPGAVLGCVRLDPSGKIVAREVRERSGDATLDRSVVEALRNATDMDKPVPPHLTDLLTKKGVCFRFLLDG
ncbi:MAG: hypothetical protein D6689_17980 [Deltaproteobacteria bacterium]|nr:MAG: hypothetical protein D6689_17980 [Deltaproteobacteria bacterium]